MVDQVRLLPPTELAMPIGEDVLNTAQFYCCIPMGYPRGHFGTTLRRPTSETTYWDDWNNPPPWS